MVTYRTLSVTASAVVVLFVAGCGGDRSSYERGYDDCYEATLHGNRDDPAPLDDEEWMRGCYAGVEAASDSR